jgi:hypothetical protein
MNSFSILNISFLLRKNKENKIGEYPIYMRFSIDQERAEISTGRSISQDYWDSKTGKADAKKKDCIHLNYFLDALRNNLYDHHTEMMKNGDFVTA